MAKEWLAEAGYPGGEGFPVVTLMHNTSEGHRAIAEAIQAMWRDTLGVEVEVVNQEWGVYLETLKNDTPLADMPHVWRLGWCADYADNNNWVHEVFNNDEGANRLRRGCLDDTCTEVEELEFDRTHQGSRRRAGSRQAPGAVQAGRKAPERRRSRLRADLLLLDGRPDQALADPHLPEAGRPALGQVDHRLGGQGSGHQVGLLDCNAMQFLGLHGPLRRQLALVTHCRHRPGAAWPLSAQAPVPRQRCASPGALWREHLGPIIHHRSAPSRCVFQSALSPD